MSLLYYALSPKIPMIDMFIEIFHNDYLKKLLKYWKIFNFCTNHIDMLKGKP